MTPKIAEEIGKYFLKMANKKRNKDSVNNGNDDDMNPNIKRNIEDSFPLWVKLLIKD